MKGAAFRACFGSLIRRPVPWRRTLHSPCGSSKQEPVRPVAPPNVEKTACKAIRVIGQFASYPFYVFPPIEIAIVLVGRLLSDRHYVFHRRFVQSSAYWSSWLFQCVAGFAAWLGSRELQFDKTLLFPRREGRRSVRVFSRAENKKTMPRRSTPDAFALQVGARIRELRYEQGLSLGALADASALSKGHLSSVEHGLAAITIGTIARLAEGFGVPPMYLLTFAKEDERAHTAELLRHMSQADVKKLRRQIQAQVNGKR